jgi:hypothetical protein
MNVETVIEEYVFHPLTGILFVSYFLMYPSSYIITLYGEAIYPSTLFFFHFIIVSIIYSLYDYVRLHQK